MKAQRFKILIVDDNTKNIQVLASLLAQENYDIDYALSGADALKLNASENFDLILLDIMMPEMDGFEVCEKIKKDPNKKEIPIIFLTAKTDIESIQKAFECGGIDYLTKPFNSHELISRVKTHLELKISRDKLKDVNLWLKKMVAQKTKELNLANKKLLELDNAKSQFLKIISHEIRTPLNGILGAVSLLKDSGLSEEAISLLEILDLSTTRFEDFSNKALDISRLNTVKVNALKKLPIKVQNTLKDVLSDLEEDIKKKHIIVSQLIDPQIKTINADSKYLFKSIHSIIDNAIRHSPNNAIITIELKNHDDYLGIHIKDEGKGFDNNFSINNIDMFTSKDHYDQNIGLSLYLTNQIIKLHDGYIKNGNNLDKGAYVEIYIPTANITELMST